MTTTDGVDNAFRRAFNLSDDFDVADDIQFEGIQGWDSVGHMNLVGEIEALIGSPLEMDEIIEMDSVRAVRNLVAGKT